MPTAQEEFRGAVPNGDDDLVAGKEGVGGFVEEPCQAEIPDFDLSSGCDHDVGGFEVTMHDPIAVEVEQSRTELVHAGAEHGGRYGDAGKEGVVVDDLQ